MQDSIYCYTKKELELFVLSKGQSKDLPYSFSEMHFFRKILKKKSILLLPHSAKERQEAGTEKLIKASNLLNLLLATFPVPAKGCCCSEAAACQLRRCALPCCWAMTAATGSTHLLCVLSWRSQLAGRGANCIPDMTSQGQMSVLFLHSGDITLLPCGEGLAHRFSS